VGGRSSVFSPFTFSLTFYCRKQTGQLTSTGVPSPPPSRGVSSPGSGGLPTAGAPAARTMTPRDTVSSRVLFFSFFAVFSLHLLLPSRSGWGGRIHGVASLPEEPQVGSLVATPPGGPPLTRSSAHTLGLTVFPEVPCCQVTLCPSATTGRAFPCTNPQQAHNSGAFLHQNRCPWG